MKTLAILIFTAFTTFSSFASVVEPLTTSVDGNTITVYFDHQKSEMVNISIVDKVGYELLSEEVQSKNRKSRRYNLEQLPYGVYTIKINMDQKIVYKEIKTEKNNTIVLEERITYKPSTTFENDKWMVNILALGERVDIKIYDAELEPVFEEKIKDTKVIAKTYDLSQLDYGVYTLNINVGETSYSKVIAKM